MPASNVRIENDDIVMPGSAAHTVTNLRAPTAPADAATKAYVDGSSSDSDKIQDATGTTRVETEEESDAVTITAGGQRTHTITEDEVVEQISQDTTTRTRAKQGLFKNWLGFGIWGPVRWVESAVDNLPIAIDALSGAVNIAGEVLNTTRLLFVGKLGSDLFLSESADVNEIQGVALFERHVVSDDSRSSSIMQFADDSSAESRLETFNDPGAGVCGFRATQNGPVVLGWGANAGQGWLCNEEDFPDLPDGEASLTRLLHRLADNSSGDFWPAFSGVANVASLDFLYAYYRRTRDIVSVYCGVRVTPTSGGGTATIVHGSFTDYLPDLEVVLGRTSCLDDGFGAPVPSIGAIRDDGEIILRFDADGTDPHDITLEVTFKRAEP